MSHCDTPSTLSPGEVGLKIEERQSQFNTVYKGAEKASYDDLFQNGLDIQEVSKKNCENLIGSVEIPVGVAGPLDLQLGDWRESVNVPLATTEGALVASVNRGCKVLRESGSVRVMVKNQGMTRSPVFACPDGASAVMFQQWFEDHIDRVREIAESTSSHLHLLSHHSWVRGRYVYVRFAFDCEEAMGMNMVTIALQAALERELKEHPEIRLVSLSSNVCTDKKDSVINSLLGRGYWVQAETTLSAEVVKKVLKTNIADFSEVHVQKNLIGSNLAGSFSQNAHVANVIAALFLATGQDPAHVVEGSKAFLMVEPSKDEKSMYVALTLPNVNVGVVGGGTGLRQQAQARALIRNGQDISASQLAGVVGAACLAGELSLLAALAENQLAYAHAKLGRGKA